MGLSSGRVVVGVREPFHASLFEQVLREWENNRVSTIVGGGGTTVRNGSILSTRVLLSILLPFLFLNKKLFPSKTCCDRVHFCCCCCTWSIHSSVPRCRSFLSCRENVEKKRKKNCLMFALEGAHGSFVWGTVWGEGGWRRVILYCVYKKGREEKSRAEQRKMGGKEPELSDFHFVFFLVLFTLLIRCLFTGRREEAKRRRSLSLLLVLYDPRQTKELNYR